MRAYCEIHGDIGVGIRKEDSLKIIKSMPANQLWFSEGQLGVDSQDR